MNFIESNPYHRLRHFGVSFYFSYVKVALNKISDLINGAYASVEIKGLGRLPCKIWVVAAEVTEGGSLLVNGSL